MLLTRSPLSDTRRCHTVRLACLIHAASVRPEPGSNSPSYIMIWNWQELFPLIPTLYIFKDQGAENWASQAHVRSQSAEAVFLSRGKFHFGLHNFFACPVSFWYRDSYITLKFLNFLAGVRIKWWIPDLNQQKNCIILAENYSVFEFHLETSRHNDLTHIIIDLPGKANRKHQSTADIFE